MKHPLCRLHPDYHLPPDIDAGRNFDGMAYARSLKEHGCDSVVFFAKCHYGHSYYPTECGNVHPRLQCDMLGEVVRGARDVGLGVTAYYSVFLDSVAVAKRPDWRLVTEDMRFGAGFDSGNFSPVCVNSGYVEELMLPQTVEITSRYDVDELFFDTMSRFTPCYCEHCLEKFGQAIPTSEDDPCWIEYVAWYKQCFDSCFARTAEVIHETKPGVGCIFNWKWGLREPSAPPKYITTLASDFPSSGMLASHHCRYYAGTGLPFDYMTGRFLHTLSEWDNCPPATMKYTAAGTIAHGGGFYIIDRQLPDGTLEPRAYEMMDEVFGFIEERRSAIEGIVHVPEIAVLYSQRSLYGAELEDFPRSDVQKEKMRTLEGISNLFIESGRHFTVISEATFAREGGRYPLLIIPEQNALDPATEKALQSYVEKGGHVIITQADDAGLPSSAVLELAGISFHGFSDRSYGYVGTELPFHARGRFAKVTPVGDAQLLLSQVDPISAGDGGKKFGHGMAPYGETSEYAAVTLRGIGDGYVAYIALPLAHSYVNFQNFYLRDLLLGLVDRLWPDAIARADTPAQVELVTTRRDNDLVLNLVNHSGKVTLGGFFHTLIEYVPPIRNVDVSVRGEVPEAMLIPGKGTLEPVERDGWSIFTVPELEYMQTLVIPGYFA